jgi:hypothetical protein
MVHDMHKSGIVIQNQSLALEALVDSIGIVGVSNMLADICFAKEEHIAVNWQDMRLANVWYHQGLAFNDMGPRLEKIANGKLPNYPHNVKD